MLYAAHPDQSDARKSEPNRHNFQSAHHSRRNAASILTHKHKHTPTQRGARGHFQRERARRVHSQQPVYFAWACVCTCFFDIHSQSPENPLRTQPFSCMHITFIKQRRRPSVSALAAKRALLLFNSINGSLFASPFVSSGLIASASESRVRPIHRL